MRSGSVAGTRARIPLASVLVIAFHTGAEAASKFSSLIDAIVPASRKTRETPKGTGNPELDRLLEDRPVPVRWAQEPSVIELPPVATAPPLERDSADTPLARLQAVAFPFLGTRYRAGGSDGNGFDCSGFVLRVVGFFGVELAGRSSPSYWKQGEAVEKDSLRAGDLVFFSDHTRSIGHVGIYLEDGSFVHASVQSGVIVSRLEEKYYRRRYKGARRIPELAEALLASTGSVAFR